MTAFFMPSETSFQRLGITASKKAVGNSVRRNRAKRILREAFRLSRPELQQLEIAYDWVLNAHSRTAEVKLSGPLEEFRDIVRRVKELESKDGEKKGENRRS